MPHSARIRRVTCTSRPPLFAAHVSERGVRTTSGQVATVVVDRARGHVSSGRARCRPRRRPHARSLDRAPCCLRGRLRRLAPHRLRNRLDDLDRRRRARDVTASRRTSLATSRTRARPRSRGPRRRRSNSRRVRDADIACRKPATRRATRNARFAAAHARPGDRCHEPASPPRAHVLKDMDQLPILVWGAFVWLFVRCLGFRRQPGQSRLCHRQLLGGRAELYPPFWSSSVSSRRRRSDSRSHRPSSH